MSSSSVNDSFLCFVIVWNIFYFSIIENLMLVNVLHGSIIGYRVSSILSSPSPPQKKKMHIITFPPIKLSERKYPKYTSPCLVISYFLFTILHITLSWGQVMVTDCGVIPFSFCPPQIPIPFFVSGIFLIDLLSATWVGKILL